MHRSIILFLLLIVYACSPAEREPITESFLEVYSDQLYSYISPDAQLEVLDSGFHWTEGPVWSDELNGVLFSDIPVNKVFLWSEAEGTTLYLDSAGYTGEVSRGGELGSNGLYIDDEGRLWLCQHGNRQLAYMNSDLNSPSTSFTGFATNWNGKRLNSPNDLARSSSGDFYFTDPPYGLEQRMEDTAKEIGFQGVYKVNPEGKVTLLDSSLSRPNGIAFSQDQTELYVANSDPERAIWVAYDLKDSTFGTRRIIRDETDRVGSSNPGLPDGFKVHSSGLLFATGPGGVLVMTPGGKVLGRIRTGVPTANCVFAANESYLYITADDYLMRVRLVN